MAGQESVLSRRFTHIKPRGDDEVDLQSLRGYLRYHDIEPFMMLAKDVTYDGERWVKEFTYVNDASELEILMSQPVEERRYHELSMPGQMVRPYLDIEVERDSALWDEWDARGEEENARRIVTIVSKIMSRHYGKWNESNPAEYFETCNIAITSSCRADKYSYHVTVPAYKVASMTEAREFAGLCAQEIGEDAVDTQVYRKWGTIRMVHCHKEMSPNVLRFIDGIGSQNESDTYAFTFPGSTRRISNIGSVREISDASGNKLKPQLEYYVLNDLTREQVEELPEGAIIKYYEWNRDQLVDFTGRDKETVINVWNTIMRLRSVVDENKNYRTHSFDIFSSPSMRFGTQFTIEGSHRDELILWDMEGFISMINALPPSWVHEHSRMLFRFCADVAAANPMETYTIKGLLQTKLNCCGDDSCMASTPNGLCRMAESHTRTVDGLSAYAGDKYYSFYIMLFSAIKHVGHQILTVLDTVNKLMNIATISEWAIEHLNDEEYTILTLGEYLMESHARTLIDEDALEFKDNVLRRTFACIRVNAGEGLPYIVKTRDERGNLVWVCKNVTQFNALLRGMSFITYDTTVKIVRGKEISTVKRNVNKLSKFFEDYHSACMINGLISDPNRGTIYNGYMNLFKPFAPKFDVEPDMSIIQPYLELQKYLIPNDVERAYLLNWFRGCVQTHMVLGYAIYAFGPKGRGKNLLCQGMEVLMGQASLSVQKFEELYKYNGTIMGRRLIMVDEIGWQRTSDESFQFLKSAITNPRLTVRSLFSMPIQIVNTTTWFFTGNDPNTFPIEDRHNDRRIIYMPITLAEKKSKAFYRRVVECFQHPAFAATWYHYLMSEPFDEDILHNTEELGGHRRIFEMLAENAIPIEHRWIRDLAVTNYYMRDDPICGAIPDCVISKTGFFDSYTAYCSRNNCKPKPINSLNRTLNMLAMAMGMTALFTVSGRKKRDRTGESYTIDGLTCGKIVDYFYPDGLPDAPDDDGDDGGEGSA